VLEININPAFRLRELKRGEGDEVVVAGAGQERYAGWGIGLVGSEVEEDTDGKNGDKPREMDV
jgi:hypothetical protein